MKTMTKLRRRMMTHNLYKLKEEDKNNIKKKYAYLYDIENAFSKGNRFSNSFDPLLNIAKDFSDTFKPYKTYHQIYNDLLQPLYGIYYILGSILLLLLLSVLILPLSPIIAAFGSKDYFSNLGEMLFRILIDSVFSTLNIFRGLTQFVATPLTWFIKMPLRGILTAITGWPKIEAEGSSVQLLVDKGKKVLKEETGEEQYSHLKIITHEIHRKFQANWEKGQMTDIGQEEENIAFAPLTNKKGININDANLKKVERYLNLFKPAEKKKNEKPSAKEEPYKQPE